MQKPAFHYVLAGLAMVAMLAIAPFYFAAGLEAPVWAIVMLIIVWLALFLLGCVWLRSRPLWVVPTPFVAAGFWLVVMAAGEAWLGWTA
jgi:hypothetical protein